MCCDTGWEVNSTTDSSMVHMVLSMNLDFKQIIKKYKSKRTCKLKKRHFRFLDTVDICESALKQLQHLEKILIMLCLAEYQHFAFKSIIT